ncbi:MAG: porin [Pseudomonadota bacterium]
MKNLSGTNFRASANGVRPKDGANKLRLTLLAAAIAALSAPSFAGEALTVYGNAMLTVQNTDDDAAGGDKWEIKSHASRFGVKGDLGISDSLEAFYQFEWEVDPADESGGDKNFKSRNQGIGLKGDFGQVLVGRWDTPLKLAQGKVDQFNDLEFADLKFIFNGETRARDTLAYTTPKFGGGFVASIATLLQEDVDTDAEGDENRDGLFDSLSYSFGWQGKDLYVAVAQDRDHDNAAYADGAETTRVVATYKIGPVQLGAMWQNYDNGVSDNPATPLVDESFDEDGMLISAAFALNDSHTLKVQHGASDIKMEGGEQTYLGWDYKMAKNVTLFAVYGETTEDADDKDKTHLAGGLKVVF